MSIYWEEVQTSVEDTSSVIKVYKPKHSELRAFVIEDKDAINYPKLSLTKEFEPLVNNFGIYFLYSKPWKHKNAYNVYVGRASKRHTSDDTDFKELQGMQRLKEHMAKKKDGTYHDSYYNDWDSAVFITTNDRIGFDVNTIVALEEFFIKSYRTAESDTFENNSQASKVFKLLNSQRGNLSGVKISELDNTINAIKDLISMRLGFGIEEKYMVQSKISMLESELQEKEIALKTKDKAENKQNNNTDEDDELLKWAKAYMEYNHKKNQLRGIDKYVKYGRVHNINNFLEKTSEVITPANIAEDMVNLIPETAFTAETKFLDPACKSGIFIIKIIERLMSTDPRLPINKDDKYKDPWDRLQHILTNQVYGLCVSYTGYMYSMSQVISYVDNLVSTMPHTKKGVVYNNTILPHIIKISNYTNGIVKGGWKKIFKDPVDAMGQNHIYLAIKEKFKMDVRNGMKFDVVIGNPPYNRGMDLDFVDLGFKLSKQYTVMITPAKWQTAEANQSVASKMTYGEFRKQLVPHMSHVVFYPECSDVFGIAQSDGITYYLIDKDTYNNCLVENKCKLQPLLNSSSIRDITKEQSLLNIGQEIVDCLRNYPKWTWPKLTYGRFEVWVNIQLLVRGSGGGISCLLMKDGNTQVVQRPHILDTQAGESNTSTASACVYRSDNIDECKSLESWINCKFTRFFVFINLSKLTGILTNHYWRFVPAPPSGKFDHIYTDKELYQAFNLPQKYIDVIEAVIKKRK